jgi:hypothetical protein
MITINEHNINNACQLFQKMSENAMQRHFTHFSNEQPFVIGYVVAMAREFEIEEHEGFLLQTAFILWQSFKAEVPMIPMITEDMIHEVEYKRLDRLEKSDNSDTDIVEGALKLISEIRQPYLIHYVNSETIAIKDSLFRNNFQELITTVLEVIIDCFDNAIHEERNA